jgi:hypothetical protein
VLSKIFAKAHAEDEAAKLVTRNFRDMMSARDCAAGNTRAQR